MLNLSANESIICLSANESVSLLLQQHLPSDQVQYCF